MISFGIEKIKIKINLINLIKIKILKLQNHFFLLLKTTGIFKALFNSKSNTLIYNDLMNPMKINVIFKRHLAFFFCSFRFFTFTFPVDF
jgi:hypothetical protein